MIYLITFLLAFCSIVYELLLGQVLSAFLGNTVLRYSVTIGLYMLAMGVGAMLFHEGMRKRAVLWLQVVELALALTGALALPILFLVDALEPPVFIFSGIAHGLILLIGVLTGIEIPLLLELKNKQKKGRQFQVLGVDYLGAFGGTLAFAFIFYPHLGLTTTAFGVASLNAFVGVSLVCFEELVAEDSYPKFNKLLGVHAVVLLLLAFGLYESHSLNEYLLSFYLAV